MLKNKIYNIERKKTMKIISLVAQNFKRIKAVEITPDGELVVLSGKNEQGKSSVLDSILAALAGKRNLPKKALRDGEEKGFIELDLDEYKVKRTFNKDGGGTLKITNKDGAVFGSPQKMLDKIVGEISFDPFEFSRMDSKKQVEIFKNITGLDFSDLEKERACIYEERKDVNRESKRLVAQRDKIEEKLPDELPDEKISVKDLMSKLDVANSKNAKIDQLIADEKNNANKMEYVRNEIKELEKQLKAKKEESKNLNAEMVKLQEKIKKSKRVNTTDIKEKLNKAEEINNNFNTVEEHKRVLKEIKEHRNKYKTLTDRIKEIDKEKELRIEKADMPINGLSFNEEGIFINGIPFEQESSSRQLKVSIAMGMALNPKLKVLLVKDGGLLDKNSIKEVEKIVKEKDYQLWLEKVGNGGKAAIVIEDGTVKENKK